MYLFYLRISFLLLCIPLIATTVLAQGPPITADKPIMLGAKRIIVKTLTEVRFTEQGNFTKIPLMVHYLPTSNSLVAIHLPAVYQKFDDANGFEEGWSLGDIQLLGKYQFFRKDETGKTLRMVLKTLQTFPTGPASSMLGLSMDQYQSYVGLVTGFESIKYGLTGEIGYNYVPSNLLDQIRLRVGAGLPLRKPAYPVNQINLYFEYAGNIWLEIDESEWLYAQGIQYAIHRITLEAAVQFPLYQTLDEDQQRNLSFFIGTRYVF